MASKATDSSQGKETNDFGDGSVMSSIQERRITAKNKELEEITARHESLLRELFWVNNLNNTSTFTPTHWKKIEREELQLFLQNNKLEVSKLSTPDSVKTSTSTEPAQNSSTTKSGISSVTTQNNSISNLKSITLNSLQHKADTETNPQDSPTAVQPPTPTEQSSQTKRQRRVTLPPPERMVTRAASGAINPKSVDEILKEAERNAFPSTSTSLTSPTSSTKINVATKKQTLQRTSTLISKGEDGRNASSASSSRGHTRTRGYDRFTLISNFQSQPVFKALQTSNKVLTTEDWKIARDEIKYVRVTEKIEDLKASNRWSFKQIEQHKAPPRTMTHWDYLIAEARWLQADFKEERRWKIAAAFLMSRWIKEYHEEKQNGHVKCRKSKSAVFTESPAPMEIDDPTPNDNNSGDGDGDCELVTVKAEPNEDNIIAKDNSADERRWQNGHMSSDEIMIDIESVDDDTSTRHLNNGSTSIPSTVSPSVVKKLRRSFLSMPTDQINFCLPENQGLELETIHGFSVYEGLMHPSEKDIYIDDAEFSRIVPISKVITRRMNGINKKSMCRKSEQQLKPYKIKTEVDDFGLFDEQVVPSLLFTPKNPFEKRTQIIVNAPQKITTTQTQGWSAEDDDILMSLVKQMQFNWDLISDAINSSRSLINGCVRTPWDCYQRWLQKEDTSQYTIPGHATTSDDGYGISGRSETGDGTTNGIPLGPSTPSVIRVKKDQSRKAPKFDPLKNNKRHSSIQEAIRKAVKKRSEETTKRLQPKKTHDQPPPPPTTRVPTPLDLSRMKSDQEKQYQQALLERRQATALAVGHARQPIVVRPTQQPTIATHVVRQVPNQQFFMMQRQAANQHAQQTYSQMQPAMAQAVQAQVQAQAQAQAAVAQLYMRQAMLQGAQTQVQQNASQQQQQAVPASTQQVVWSQQQTHGQRPGGGNGSLGTNSQ